MREHIIDIFAAFLLWFAIYYKRDNDKLKMFSSDWFIVLIITTFSIFLIKHNHHPMKENKLYKECREEAFKILRDKNKETNPIIISVLSKNELNQLTAELYAQRFADWIQPKHNILECYKPIPDTDLWKKVGIMSDILIGTTQDLHDRFVEEMNG